MKPTAVRAVQHLCPAITKVAKIVRRHAPVGHPDRKEALQLLREIQDGIHQLRYNANHRSIDDTRDD